MNCRPALARAAATAKCPTRPSARAWRIGKAIRSAFSGIHCLFINLTGKARTMNSLFSTNNVVFVDNCKSLHNLGVTLEVTEDLVTLGNTGFSLQLNCYPQIASKSPNATPQTGDGSLTWFQYVLYVTNNQVTWDIQYWANNAHSYEEGPPKIIWPPEYTPNPSGTAPWLSVFPNTAITGTLPTFASNQVPAGSVIKIQLATDSS
jgi:hypothetical protein